MQITASSPRSFSQAGEFAYSRLVEVALIKGSDAFYSLVEGVNALYSQISYSLEESDTSMRESPDVEMLESEFPMIEATIFPSHFFIPYSRSPK